MANRKSDFIGNYRQAATSVLTALLTIEALHKEAKIMGYPGTLTPEDFAGANADIDKVKLTTAANGMATILTTLTDAVLKNLYEVRL